MQEDLADVLEDRLEEWKCHGLADQHGSPQLAHTHTHTQQTSVYDGQLADISALRSVNKAQNIQN